MPENRSNRSIDAMYIYFFGKGTTTNILSGKREIKKVSQSSSDSHKVDLFQAVHIECYVYIYVALHIYYISQYLERLYLQHYFMRSVKKIIYYFDEFIFVLPCC